MRLTLSLILIVFALTAAAGVWEDQRNAPPQEAAVGIVKQVTPLDNNVQAEIETQNKLGHTVTIRRSFCYEHGNLKTDGMLAVEMLSRQQLLERAQLSKKPVEFQEQGPWSPCLTFVRLPAQ